ncbi:hypothetical protein MAQ5080_00518 [Marinomonas aquimarina]|uniref:DUF5610 domain-containing protein n=1 Tax=Marinomonas aquimarina TaxID=295068 RepID=A0A1A8T4K1_9GAMM|nr:DUF5610 domain-containing protein [Marinomonas aquimarina]SBS26432.1 hypothetical protein MAQ5080_00518 [Marinomonas aquimarina]
MSDPLKGLGQTMPSFTTNHNHQTSHTDRAQTPKQWGADGYMPSSSSYRSMGVIQQSLSARLAASFSSPNAEASEQATTATAKSDNDFSPEKVAQRIMSHVGNYMEKLQKNGANDERLAAVFDTAKEAVQKGMDDAKEKLDALGWLVNGGVQEGIDETQSLLDEGFEALRKSFFEPADVNAASQVSMASEMSYRREDYSQIQMTTQEGDVVKLNLYALSATEQGEAASMSDNGISYSRYENSSQSFAFDFSVEGDLNDDELSAIQDMMESVGKVSDLFYDGDVAGALQKGFDMGFDASQLASFSMTLQTSQTMKSSQAVSAYGQNPGMRSIQEPLGEYRQTLEEAVKKTSELFDDYRDVVENTLSDIMAMREEQAQKMADIRQVFDYQQQMIERISQWFAPEAQQSPQDEENVAGDTLADGENLDNTDQSNA